jgi:hypothetical protein
MSLLTAWDFIVNLVIILYEVMHVVWTPSISHHPHSLYFPDMFIKVFRTQAGVVTRMENLVICIEINSNHANGISWIFICIDKPVQISWELGFDDILTFVQIMYFSQLFHKHNYVNMVNVNIVVIASSMWMIWSFILYCSN